MAATYRIKQTCLYLLGSLDRSVTVHSQQNRALNLAWSLIDDDRMPRPKDQALKIAVVGAGFAGLTFAAALLKKHVNAIITLFDERDTLLPLQQGSDSRWLHPNIYDWPSPESHASVAMLPVLNWIAGRASDVVVQVLGEWKRTVEDVGRSLPHRFFANTRHLQIAPCGDRARVEWVGEAREFCDGTVPAEGSSQGSSEIFDLVILAIGFGAEREKQLSYWRNESYAQPSLTEQRRTFLVSGQGDGAMIDLLRVRISQYRQDRILSDLFTGKPELISALEQLRRDRDKGSLFQRFEDLAGGSGVAADQMGAAREKLAHRLRRDTDAILHLRVRNLDELFSAKTSRMSFQNALLVYLLYRCGGFSPSNESERAIRDRYGIAPEQVIRRHGTDRGRQLQRILPADLFAELKPIIEESDTEELRQEGSRRLWPGGFFGFRGRSADMHKLGQGVRRTWRKEYLPPATELLGSSVCGAIAGFLASETRSAAPFRITLHRALPLYSEELLQQTCDYQGSAGAGNDTASRVFPADVATIGLAYGSRRIVRSRRGVSEDVLVRAMKTLELNKTARKMARDVRFLLAIPYLQPETEFVGYSPVSAVLYLDSRDPNVWLNDEQVSKIGRLLEDGLSAVWREVPRWFGRLSNIPLAEQASMPPAVIALPPKVADALEMLDTTPLQAGFRRALTSTIVRRHRVHADKCNAYKELGHG